MREPFLAKSIGSKNRNCRIAGRVEGKCIEYTLTDTEWRVAVGWQAAVEQPNCLWHSGIRFSWIDVRPLRGLRETAIQRDDPSISIDRNDKPATEEEVVGLGFREKPGLLAEYEHVGFPLALGLFLGLVSPWEVADTANS